MSTKALNLIIFQTESIGEAYQLANQASLLKYEILELSILGVGGLLVLETGSLDPEIEIKKFKTQGRSSFHKKMSADIFKAYLSLNSAKITSQLAIIESSFIGNIFSICENLDTNQIVDLRLIRSAIPKVYLFLSNISDLSQFENIKNIQVTQIKNIDSGLKNYLDLVP